MKGCDRDARGATADFLSSDVMFTFVNYMRPSVHLHRADELRFPLRYLKPEHESVHIGYAFTVMFDSLLVIGAIL